MTQLRVAQDTVRGFNKAGGSIRACVARIFATGTGSAMLCAISSGIDSQLRRRWTRSLPARLSLRAARGIHARLRHSAHTSPVVGAGIALVCAPKNSPVFAMSLDSKGTDVQPLWATDPKVVTSDVSTPAFYEGKFYVLDSGRRTLSCLEPKTGKVIWTGETGSKSKFESSPTIADGKVYMTNFWGDVYVAKAGGDTFELLSVNEMGDGTKPNGEGVAPCAARRHGAAQRNQLMESRIRGNPIPNGFVRKPCRGSGMWGSGGGWVSPQISRKAAGIDPL